MKRLTIILVLVLFAMIAKGQTYMPAGMVVWVKKASAITDEVTFKKIIEHDGETYAIKANGDTVYFGTPIAKRLNGSTVYVTQIPDTVQHTSNFTLALTDVNKDLYCIKATSIAVTVPTSASVAIPIGTTINFYGEGTGIMIFKAASGVHLHSDKDSIASSRIHQVVSLKKRGNNYWILYGAITD